MKQKLFLIGFISVIFCQNPSQNSMPAKPFGTNSGVFFNAGTDQIDFDTFFEIQTSLGLFGEVWVTELDLDTGTETEINSTFGWMKEVAPNVILGGGYSKYTNQNLKEIFLGGNIGLVTLVGFFGIDDTPANFLGILDLDIGILKDSRTNLSIMGVKESSGSDFYLRLTRDFDHGIKLGYTLSRERFESEETKTFIKQGHTKSWTVPIQKDGFFNTIYIGITF